MADQSQIDALRSEVEQLKEELAEYGRNPLQAQVNRLSDQNHDLQRRLADAEGEGCTLHKHAPHGKEAEELRKGVEKLLAKEPTNLRTALFLLLDRVDARDSLTHLRANEELRDIRRELKRQITSRQSCSSYLLEMLVDNLDRGGAAVVTTKSIRAALVALGHKRAELPQDLPPAGGKRGRR